MLGEAARTGKDAERYFDRYMAAIDEIGKAAGPLKQMTQPALMERPGLSVKLSAIHPRFEPFKIDRVRAELVPDLVAIARAAKAAGLTLTVDAEEADRLDLTLQVFGEALADPSLAGWHGFGLAVQAYGKRALPVLRWLKRLSAMTGRRLPVRLVKGAYWDSEIKWAQERGLPDYPVFTRKANTDVSYLACARYLLAEPDAFYPQFATHNAHTVAAVHAFGANADYEFQRLHGMGEALYTEVVGAGRLGRACRIYAPVGEHEDLLAYLVRRLLENGANTSFVNRLADDELPVAEIIQDPVERAETADIEIAPGHRQATRAVCAAAPQQSWPAADGGGGVGAADRRDAGGTRRATGGRRHRRWRTDRRRTAAKRAVAARPQPAGGHRSASRRRPTSTGRSPSPTAASRPGTGSAAPPAPRSSSAPPS